MGNQPLINQNPSYINQPVIYQVPPGYSIVYPQNPQNQVNLNNNNQNFNSNINQNKIVYISQPNYQYRPQISQYYVNNNSINNNNKNYMKIQPDKNEYFPNSTISGHIIITIPQDVIVSDICLKFGIFEGWVFTESSERTITDANKTVITQKNLEIGKFLNIETSLISLSKGEFFIPFSIEIPDYLQPSFEYPFPNRKGYIRYFLLADVISPYIKFNVEEYVIIKSHPLEMNYPHLLNSTKNVRKWGVSDQGTTILTVNYEKNNYKFMDNVPIKVFINNYRGNLKITNINVDLIRIITFTSTNQAEKFPMEKTIQKNKYKVLIQSHSTNSFAFNVNLIDKEISNIDYIKNLNIYNNEIKDLNLLLPSCNSNLIKCEYKIQVSLDFESYVPYANKPRVFLPLSITHQLIEEYRIEKQEENDLKKAIEISKIENNNNYNENIDDNLINENNDNGNINNNNNNNSYDNNKNNSEEISENNIISNKINKELNSPNLNENNNDNINDNTYNINYI